MLTERRIKVGLDAREIWKRFKISATVKIGLVKRQNKSKLFPFRLGFRVLNRVKKTN
jgi:hypothetical protein